MCQSPHWQDGAHLMSLVQAQASPQRHSGPQPHGAGVALHWQDGPQLQAEPHSHLLVLVSVFIGFSRVGLR